MEANARIGADSILLPAATYFLTISGTDEDQSTTGDLDITEQLTITGDQAGGSIIDAANLDDRVIHILNSAVSVSISKV